MTKDMLDSLDNWRIACEDAGLPSGERNLARQHFYAELFDNWTDISKMTRVGLNQSVKVL